MIKVQRTPKPEILRRNEAKWTKEILSAKTPEARHKAIERYRHEGIKNVLVEMFAGKCAYCESKILHIDYGDIEHFKPKSKYPKEAVKWENLLLSCKRCNSAAYKGDKFPSQSEGGLLVNPCDDEPNDHFRFEFDKEMQLAIVIGKTKRGETSEKIYGLNKPDLLKQRSTQIRRLVLLAAYYATDERVKNVLDEAAEGTSEYAAFARMVKQTFLNNG